MKFDIACCMFWAMCVAIAGVSLLQITEESHTDSIILLLICVGFLILSLWNAHHQWILNDKGLSKKLEQAIRKNKPETAARCIRQLTTIPPIPDVVRTHLIISYLIQALEQQRWEVAKAMLKSSGTRTIIQEAFHECVSAHCVSAVRFLLENGANPDAGETYPPILTALAENEHDLVALLLEYGANPQGVHPDFNPDHLTALHVLCSQKRQNTADSAHICTATKLLQAGADINAQTLSGFTPLDACLDKRETPNETTDDLVLYLRSVGAKRGTELNVPQASYCAELRIKGNNENLPISSHHGCNIHITPSDIPQHEHTGKVYCQADKGEQPIAAAYRLACAIQELCKNGCVIAADLGGGFTPAAEIANAEQPLLYMLQLHPCTFDSHAGLETEGMNRFGLPELRAINTVGTHVSWLTFAISHILSSFLHDNACPVANNFFYLGEHNHDAFLPSEEYLTVCPKTRQHGNGICLEISHHYD